MLPNLRNWVLYSIIPGDLLGKKGLQHMEMCPWGTGRHSSWHKSTGCARLPAMLKLPHADVVGSLLRPPELIAAREDIAAGRRAFSEFKRIEDAAVDSAVAAQENAGLDILTDGEMRRLSFQSQMPEAVEGFGEFDIDAFLWGDWRGGRTGGRLA